MGQPWCTAVQLYQLSRVPAGHRGRSDGSGALRNIECPVCVHAVMDSAWLKPDRVLLLINAQVQLPGIGRNAVSDALGPFDGKAPGLR